MKTKTKPTKSKKSVKNKKKYKVRNWREYNQSLVNRGAVMFWISKTAQDNWYNTQPTGQRGKPRLYSDLAIETAITIQQVFGLALRQTEGFLTSLFQKLNNGLTAPDYSTLSIRAANLNIAITAKTASTLSAEPLHIVVDSTGAKVYGEGEWKVRQHGWGKHRTWRKLHIGVDEKTGEIKAAEVTGNDAADCEILPGILDQIPGIICQVSADGAYDRRICYEALNKRGIVAAVPPQQNARIWQHGNTSGPPLARDENLRQIRKIGRAQWKREINYHRRSKAENAIFRLKTILTDRLSARRFSGQIVQLLLRCKILNKMMLLGMPQSEVVA